MKNITKIFTTLFLALSIMPVFALEVSGTVYDEITNGDKVEKEGIPYANVRAILSDGTRQTVAVADIDGNFTAIIPDDAQLEISYAGHKPKIIENPGKNLNIKLEDTNTMQEVVSSACSPQTLEEINAKTGTWENGKCVPETCIGEPNEYEIKNNSCVKVNCTSAEIANLKNAQSTKVVNGKCVIDECIGEPGEYQKSDYICEKAKCTKAEESDLKTNHHAKKVVVQNGKCVPTDCVTGYHTDNDVCVQDECESSEEDWIDGKGCTKVRCTEDEIRGVLNANGTDPEWNGKECVPKDCVNGYHLNNRNKCVHDKCTKPEDDWDESLQKCVQVRCSEAQIQAANATSKSKWDKQTQRCEFACDTAAGFTLNSQNKCEQTLCSEKDAKRMTKNNVLEYELEKGVCIATKCISDNYEVTADKTACKNKKCKGPEFDVVNGNCVQKRCTDAQKKEKHSEEEYWDGEKCVATKCDEKIYTLDTSKGECVKIDQRSDEEKKKDLEDKQKAYEEAKAKEQSTANKTLTALTTAATGIGGMELAQGLAEQKSDKAADADMTAYIETMRCTYGDGKQVKAGPDEIELPGANNQELMNLRGQYLALAQDLKERKTALGMKPGIESETILDRASTGLYDDETIGINNGAYASLYRAEMLESEEDQKKIDDAASTSKKRVTGGAIAAGAGVVVGIAGNSLINGKLGELIKKKKADKNADKTEKEALERLQKCLNQGGAKNTNKLKFDNFTPSVLHLDKIACTGDAWKDKVKGREATNLFPDTDDEETIKRGLIGTFGCDLAGKLLDENLCQTTTTENTSQRQNAATPSDANATPTMKNTSQRQNAATPSDANATPTEEINQNENNEKTNVSDTPTSSERAEKDIQECIDEINKKTEVLSRPGYIGVYNMEKNLKYDMFYTDAAEQLSEKFKENNRGAYKVATPDDAPEACDVLKKLNEFIKQHDWDNENDGPAYTVEERTTTRIYYK